MNKAILLNPNQKLELIKYQKELISFFTYNGISIFPDQPLFAFFSSQETDSLSTKEIKELLKSVSIQKTCFSGKKLVLPVSIQISDQKIIHGEFQLLTVQQEIEFSEELISKMPLFDKKIKIFRIGNVKQKTHTWEVWDDIWCKIK